MANQDFEDMMRRWGIEPPTGFLPARICLEEFLTKWCYERFPTPIDAVEALRQGENIEEASASLFWYCYSYLQDFTGEVRWVLKEDQYDTARAKELIKRIEAIGPQLDKIRESSFTLDDIKYPLKKTLEWGKPYIETIVSAALIILHSRGRKWHHDVQKLITAAYGLIGDIPIGESGYELEIGLTDLEMEAVGDDEYRLTGDVFYFLTMIACIVVWDSYANIASKQGKYRDALDAYIKELDFYFRTVVSELPGEMVWAEDESSFLRLPYSESTSADAKMFKKIIDTWEQAKKSLSSDEDWQNAAELLEKLHELPSYVLYKCTEEEISEVFGMKDIEKVDDYIRSELRYCRSQAEVLMTCPPKTSPVVVLV